MSTVSIIMPNFNGGSLLRQSLTSLGDLLGRALVVDDGSADGSVDLLRTEFPSVRVIAREQNGGFSAAVNDGIRACECDFVALLNNDVEVTPGFLDPILPMFEDEALFAVSPRIMLPARGNVDEGCKSGYWHHGVFYTTQRQGVDQITPVLYANGCAAVYRRSMLEELGGFDEAYSPFYWEDTDLGYRAWKRGWESLYQPASSVVHQHSASISRLDPIRTRRIQLRNAYMFIWRNIEDPKMLAAHRRWLPFVLAKKAIVRDLAFPLGWKDARPRKRECVEARNRDSAHRKLTDEQILGALRQAQDGGGA